MHVPSLLPLGISALSVFLIGGLWYSPLLFLKPWLAANDSSIEAMKAGSKHPAQVFGVSFLFALLLAFSFGAVVGPDPSLAESLRLGLLVGLGFVGATFGINYQFANRKWMLWFVDTAYHIVVFLVIGLVFGLLG